MSRYKQRKIPLSDDARERMAKIFPDRKKLTNPDGRVRITYGKKKNKDDDNGPS